MMHTESQHQDNQIVLLIHGLIRSHKSMRRLAHYLNHHGYETVIYDYPSHQYHIKQHGLQLRDKIVELLIAYPTKKLSFVTHSLGGIIAREALNNLTADHLKRCEHLIMLAPPTQGSSLARLLTKCVPIVSSLIKPLSELSSSQEAYVHQVGIPHGLKIGVIAGKFDAKTPPRVTHIHGEKDFIVINSAHTFIMNHPKARKAILNFLSSSTFL